MIVGDSQSDHEQIAQLLWEDRQHDCGRTIAAEVNRLCADHPIRVIRRAGSRTMIDIVFREGAVG